MSINSEKVKEWRRTSKDRIIQSMGGCCQICKYNKYSGALELHHIDPTQKDIAISKIRSNCSSWESIVKELRKCILLCANCHREVHGNETALPENYSTFNEDYANYKFKQHYNHCPICNNTKLKSFKYCSTKCSQQGKQLIDWNSIDLEALLKELKTRVAVAEHLGVSDRTVGKRLKRLAN